MAFAPFALLAQISAGDPTGLLYSTVGEEVHPLYGPPPMSTMDTASIDLDGDGTNEIQFVSGNIHAFDADGSYNHAMMLHGGVEVALDIPLGWVAKRFDAMDPIDATLNWQAFDVGGANTLALASELTNFGGQWVTTGGDQWLVNGATATQGYMAVRIVDGAGSRYGWVGLVSYVSQDSAWLQINDMAIEAGTNIVVDASALDQVTVRLISDGTFFLRGDLSGVQQIILRDISGRVIRQLSGSSPYMLDIASEAKGTYILTVVERSRTRSFKLVW